MKRTKSINLERMRKATALIKLKPIVLSIAAFSLVGCSDTRKADIYSSVAHCKNKNPSSGTLCEKAYEKALTKSVQSGPKYRSRNDCASDFGSRNCVPYKASNGANLFMPAVAAFALSQSLKNNGYQSSPLYTSHYYGSGSYNRWTTVDGRSYQKRYGSMTVAGDTFKPKPKVVRTMSRGGFGSTVAAKSNWGGRSSRGGWGG